MSGIKKWHFADANKTTTSSAQVVSLNVD